VKPHAAIAESYLQPRRISGGGVALVVALHLAAFWLLLQMQVIEMPAPLSTLSVHLIQPAALRPQAPVTPPKPKPVERRPAPAPQPVPLAMPAAAAAPAATVATPSVPAPAAAPAPAPAAPSAPRFDADYLDNPKPAYPSLSRRLGEEGKVVLRVHVLPEGRADEIHIHAASGSPRLDQAALDAVRRWRFVPARQGGSAIAAWVLVPIVFTLKE
jgi:protein TonB